MYDELKDELRRIGFDVSLGTDDYTSGEFPLLVLKHPVLDLIAVVQPKALELEEQIQECVTTYLTNIVTTYDIESTGVEILCKEV